MLNVLFTCRSSKIQSLLENVYSFIGLFIKSADRSFFDSKTDNDQTKSSLQTLVTVLSDGLSATPRIKKFAGENVRALR